MPDRFSYFPSLFDLIDKSDKLLQDIISKLDDKTFAKINQTNKRLRETCRAMKNGPFVWLKYIKVTKTKTTVFRLKENSNKRWEEVNDLSYRFQVDLFEFFTDEKVVSRLNKAIDIFSDRVILVKTLCLSKKVEEAGVEMINRLLQLTNPETIVFQNDFSAFSLSDMIIPSQETLIQVMLGKNLKDEIFLASKNPLEVYLTPITPKAIVQKIQQFITQPAIPSYFIVSNQGDVQQSIFSMLESLAGKAVYEYDNCDVYGVRAVDTDKYGYWILDRKGYQLEMENTLLYVEVKTANKYEVHCLKSEILYLKEEVEKMEVVQINEKIKRLQPKSVVFYNSFESLKVQDIHILRPDTIFIIYHGDHITDSDFLGLHCGIEIYNSRITHSAIFQKIEQYLCFPSFYCHFLLRSSTSHDDGIYDKLEMMCGNPVFERNGEGDFGRALATTGHIDMDFAWHRKAYLMTKEKRRLYIDVKKHYWDQLYEMSCMELPHI